jgi:hypothetical protein
MQNGSHAKDETPASGADVPPAADLITPVPQGFQPNYYNQKTRAEDSNFGIRRGENASSDVSRVSNFWSRDSTRQLRSSSFEEDEICPSAPIWNKPTETTALLGKGTTSGREAIVAQWDEDAVEGKSDTTRKHELVLLVRNASPLIITCLLQYTLTGASVLAVGHLGRNELGAVSLAIMTSNITGYVIYEGLSTGLDTLCAQAYGSGKLHLVGLHLQRMIYFLWLITIPIAAIWLSGTQLLLLVIPEEECARLAGLYLKVLVLGAPGFAAFEAGKRFVQAQGLFFANLYVLLFCAPLNAFMNWLFVWVCQFRTRSRGTANGCQTAFPLGIHRCTHCRRDNAQSPCHLPCPIRLFYRWFTMLAGLQQTSPTELGPNGQARLLRVFDGHSRISSFRNPHPRLILPLQYHPRRSSRARITVNCDIPDPFPYQHCGEYEVGKSHRCRLAGCIEEMHPGHPHDGFRRWFAKHDFTNHIARLHPQALYGRYGGQGRHRRCLAHFRRVSTFRRRGRERQWDYEGDGPTGSW